MEQSFKLDFSQRISPAGDLYISDNYHFDKTLTADPKITAELARIWAQVLGVKKVGAEDNFFALGGHSLLAVKLIAAVQEKTSLGDTLKLSDLFDFPTLGAFSEHLQFPSAPGEEWGEL